MEDDFSDILGGSTIPVVRGTQSRWSRLSFGDYTFILGALLVCYVVGLRLWEALLLWREKSYKLSIRRRHGIPDDDHRPFNVAFAAVVRAREAKERRPRSDQVLRGQEPQTALQEQALRQRAAYSQNVSSARSTQLSNTLPPRSQSTNNILAPGMINAPLRSQSTTASPTRLANVYQNQHRISGSSHQESGPSPLPGTTRKVSRRNMEIIVDGSKKRTFDGDEPDANDQIKKTRIEGDEYIDGGEDAEWQERERDTQRGSKRGPGEEDDGEAFSLKRARDKRARKISLESSRDVGYEMDVDDLEEQDDVSELKSVARGKKRDRAEAGSTFGGDDYDSTIEAEAEDDSKDRRRRRKRRSVTKRKSDAGKLAHGQKRDRDAEAESDLEIDDSAHRKSRKKRGKKSSLSGRSDEEDRRNGSDVSMEESPSKTRGRRVGEEWESNGVRYKLSTNGQRLQQVLIKRARQKFPMPKDSQHPDRQANLEVYVETWLSEEELKEAKAQHLLAWQESPKTSVEPETPASELQDQASEICEGKDLLWNSTSKAPALILPSLPSTPQKGAHHQAIAPVSSLQTSLYQRQGLAGKRVSSTGRVTSFSGLGQPATPGATSAGLTESVNGQSRTTPRVFSKWEKQDLEANAMMKMREANRRKEAEKEQKAKEEREKAERERLEKERAEKEKKARESAATAAPTIPSITVTQPSEGVAKAPTPFASSAGVGEAKDAAAKPLFGPAPGASAPPFSFPQFKASAAAPAKPKEPTAAAESKPAFSFGAPAVAPSMQPPSFGPTPAAPAEKKPEQPQPAAASSFAPPSTAPTAPSFSFGPSPTQAPQTPEKKEPTSQTGSLLSRLGPPQPEKASAQPATAAPAFSFAQPSTSPFGTTTTPQQPPPAAPPAAASGATAAPKFSFSFGKPATTPSTGPATVPPATDAMDVNSKPSQPTFSFKPAAPAASTTTPTGAAPTSKFTFGATSGSGIAFSPAPSASSASGATSGAAPPKLSFVTPASSSGSAFGSTTTPSGAPSGEALKPTFTFGATTTPTRPPFGATGTPAAGSQPSISGGQAQSPFGVLGGAASGTTQTGSTFGMASRAPKMDATAPSTDVSKPMFGSGATAGGSLFGASKPAAGSATVGVVSGEAAKPTFSFGGSGSAFGAMSTTGQASKPSFSFGGAGTTTGSTMGTAGSSTQPASSPFNATSNIFSGNSGDTTNKNIFGTTSAVKPEQPKPAFSFGSTASSTTDGTKVPVFPFGKTSATSTTTAATGSATPFSFGFGNASKNISTSSTQPSSAFGSQPASTSNASGFGNPSTTTTSTPASFTFGKSAGPSEGQQQQ